jgi:Ran GTPase-activating protein (RanGAP) involved in mRNA processing and transport
MGKDYANSFAKAIRHLSPDELHLSSNRIEQESAVNILKNVSKNMTILDLSGNCIGLKGSNFLSKRILQCSEYKYVT